MSIRRPFIVSVSDPRGRLLLLLLPLIALLTIGGPISHAQTDAFFPDSLQFDSDIPSPGEFLERDVGARHTRHARIVAYFRMLARRSDRMTVTEIGKTNELRSMIFGIVTAPEHHENLDALRRQHLRLSDPSASVENVADQPCGAGSNPGARSSPSEGRPSGSWRRDW